jgi:tetratricopeptide (TPR) repeat protein
VAERCILKPFHSILLLAAVQAACLIEPSCVAGQRPGSPPQTPHGTQSDAATGTADLLVTIRDDKKGELSYSAKVTLRTRNGDPRGVTMSEKGRAQFRSIALGEYEVQVEAPGYATTKAIVSLERPGESHNLDIKVLPGSGSAGANTPPPLSLKEQKELTAGLRALQAQKLEEARKHFLTAAKTAPNHPDVDYLLGVLATMTGDMGAAKDYLENAATRYQHLLSLTALGEIYLNEGNLALAQQRLEAALKLAPNTWRADQLLAAVELKQASYPLAIQSAEHALQIGKSEAKGARLTLADALYATGNHQRSVQVLNELLKENPTHEQTKEAQRLLEANRGATAPSSTEGTLSANLSSATFAIAPILSSANLPSALANPLTTSPHWFPPNVDDSIPPADAAVSCPLPQIVRQAGDRVLEFVGNVDRFTATESLSHQTLNEFGLAVRSEKIKFNYLVSIQEMKPGVFDVQEYRDGLTTNDIFPEHVATLGTVAMVFVFHPNYVGDFDFGCEGRAHLGSQEAWQIHFSQKADRASRLRSYRLGTRYFRVGVKGRAWISTETSQVLRMETDLVSKVPEIRLHAEHQDILYGPVPFQKKHMVLWLPLATETYLDFNGHRIHRRQDLSNYLLFWVDDRETIEKPKATEVPQESSPGT